MGNLSKEGKFFLDRLYFYGCSVNEDSVISTNSSDAGGFVGHGSYITIFDSVNSGSVNGTYPVGGFIGSNSYGFDITISGSVNQGSVTGSDYSVGGFIGNGSGSCITISGSANSGNVKEKNSPGGFIGHSKGFLIVISDSINRGDITGSWSSGFISHNDQSTVTIENSYSLTKGASGYSGAICSKEQLNSKDFYTGMLGWSEDIWDLSDLDVENGKYPKLKH